MVSVVLTAFRNLVIVCFLCMFALIVGLRCLLTPLFACLLDLQSILRDQMISDLNIHDKLVRTVVAPTCHECSGR
jgi:hypothetical protein